MPSINRIQKALLTENVNAKVIEEIIGDGDIVNVIQRMDNLLEPEIKCSILDSCACCTKNSKSRDKKCKDYGKMTAGKPLLEKINSLAGIDFGMVSLNKDNCLTVEFCWDADGNRTCSCGDIKVPIVASRLLLKNKKIPIDDRIMPLTYCLCCAGHFRYHLQNALGIKLKTKEIISSPINSKGEKPCKFLLEIIE
jgi:hypothetical protein